LYRAAQEAVSNARKHAPGASVSLRLDFDAAATVLIVRNGPCPDHANAHPLSQSGSGLASIRGLADVVILVCGAR
ncbi:MAG TPA: two-component sensor histidine kinase, partial [Pseudonocardiaceae bacterium]